MKKELIFLVSILLFQYGDPEETRTLDPLIRSQVLYPTELQGHLGGSTRTRTAGKGFAILCLTSLAMEPA